MAHVISYLVFVVFLLSVALAGGSPETKIVMGFAWGIGYVSGTVAGIITVTRKR